MQLNENTIKLALRNPLNYVVRWQEPWDGRGADGAEVLVNVTLEFCVQDCINHQRHSSKSDLTSNHRIVYSDADLLWNFIVVHWAELAPKEIRVSEIAEELAKAIDDRDICEFKNYGGTDE